MHQFYLAASTDAAHKFAASTAAQVVVVACVLIVLYALFSKKTKTSS